MIEVAAALSALVKHWVDLIIILVLLVFNAVVGFWQEYQAANAVEALKKQLALKARVKRNGKWEEVDAANLVPGDTLRVRLGDMGIPAKGLTGQAYDGIYFWGTEAYALPFLIHTYPHLARNLLEFRYGTDLRVAGIRPKVLAENTSLILFRFPCNLVS